MNKITKIAYQIYISHGLRDPIKSTFLLPATKTKF